MMSVKTASISLLYSLHSASLYTSTYCSWPHTSTTNTYVQHHSMRAFARSHDEQVQQVILQRSQPNNSINACTLPTATAQSLHIYLMATCMRRTYACAKKSNRREKLVLCRLRKHTSEGQKEFFVQSWHHHKATLGTQNDIATLCRYCSRKYVV